MEHQTVPPPDERFKHGHTITLCETSAAGVFAHQNHTETQLDFLFYHGFLGQDDNGKRRYDAGLWLYQLYNKTHPSEGVMSYHDVNQREHEMSDAMAWNLKCYNETSKDLKTHWKTLYQCCCLGRYTITRSGAVSKLRAALDGLADLRGI